MAAWVIFWELVHGRNTRLSGQPLCLTPLDSIQTRSPATSSFARLGELRMHDQCAGRFAPIACTIRGPVFEGGGLIGGGGDLLDVVAYVDLAR